MRDYSKVSPRFWSGETGRVLRRSGRDVQLLALYLVTCENASMLGLYYLPLPTLCHEAGFTKEGALKALRRASEGGFAMYDEASELVWVPEMAKIQIEETLKPKDKRILGVVKALKPFLKHRFGREFYEKYRRPFNLPDSPFEEPLPSPLEGAPKALRSQEQEQITDNEQQKTTNDEQEQQGLVVAGSTLGLNGSSPAAIAERYVACFDATFNRHVSVTPDIPGKVRGLLDAGYQPWQIVAVPILVDANMDDAHFRKELQTEMLLRDGKHPRTANGRTTGATHWLERELQRADRTVLDERLTEIAKQFGVLEPLMQLGVSLRRESGL